MSSSGFFTVPEGGINLGLLSKQGNAKDQNPIDPGSDLGLAMSSSGSLADLNINIGTAQNAVMNGAMAIWQRGITFAAAAHNAVTADRWRYQKLVTGAVHTISRSSTVPDYTNSVGFPYSLLLTCTTADASLGASDYVSIMERIEGLDWSQFHGQACTMSFWVRASKVGTYCVALTNQAQNRCLILPYSINTANTWEFKTLSIPAYSSGTGWSLPSDYCAVHFVLMCGSGYQNATAGEWLTGGPYYATSAQVNLCDTVSATLYITGVQIQRGTIATAFDFLPVGEELLRCQRYYEKSFPLATTPGYGGGLNVSSWGVQVVGASAAQASAIRVEFKARKYAAITGSNSLWYNPVTAASPQIRNMTVGADCTGTSLVSSSQTGMLFSCATPAGSAAGDSLAIGWTADAEL